MSIQVTGSFKHIENFFDRIIYRKYYKALSAYAERGVSALQTATPVDSGKTASSWSYEISEADGKVSIVWINSNVKKGVNIAIILDTGHGTGTGGYVVGRHYIEPAIRPLFDQMAEELWKEVTRT